MTSSVYTVTPIQKNYEKWEKHQKTEIVTKCEYIKNR